MYRSEAMTSLPTRGETVVLSDRFEGSTQNTNLWAFNSFGFSTMQGSGNLSIAGDLTNNDYSNVVSLRRVWLLNETPLLLELRGRISTTSPAVPFEFGWGNPVGAAALSDGVLIQFTNQTVIGSIMENGSPVGSTPTLTLPSGTADYLTIRIVIYRDYVYFDVSGGYSSGTPVALVSGTAGFNSATGKGVGAHRSVYFRLFNSGSPSQSGAVNIAAADARYLDAQATKPWPHQLASLWRNAASDPTAFTQLANWTNNTQPATVTLSNTAASYTTLGGQWLFTAVAGAETDYCLFGFAVPTGYTLHVTEFAVSATVVGAAVGAAATIFLWGLGLNGASANLSSNGAQRVTLGIMSVLPADPIGARFQPNLEVNFDTPLTTDSGKTFCVILRIPGAVATPGQQLRGHVRIGGYLE